MAEEERHPAEDALLGVVDAAVPSIRARQRGRLPATLYRYVWRVSGRQQVTLILLTLLILPLSLAPLELQRRIVDDAIVRGDVRLLLYLSGIYLAVVLLHGVFKFVRSVYEGRIGEGAIRTLRLRLARHRAGAGEADRGGRAVSMIAAEAEELGSFIGESISFPLLQAGTLLSAAVYMLVVEPQVALVAFALFLPSILMAPWIQGRINQLVERRTLLLRELGAEIAERGASDGGSLIDRIYGARMRIQVLKYVFKFVHNLVGSLGPVGVLLFGGWMVIRGQTEIGVVVAFISGYEKIVDPARELLNFYRRMAQTRVQYRMIAEAVRREQG